MINIVEATEEHLPSILEIGKEAISPNWTYNILLNELNNGDSTFIVAVPCKSDKTDEPSPCLIGFVVLRQVGDDGEILQIAVDKSSRRCGVGDLLMTAAIDYAAEEGFMSVFLEVRESSTAAVSLYKKHGFEPIRTRKDYYNDPIEDAIIMKRDIK